MFHLYGLFIGLAVVTGWSVAEKIEPKVGKYAPWIIIGALFGARTYHVIDLWSYYSQYPMQILMVQNGGLGIYGGIIGGVIVALILKMKWSDLAAIATALPLSQAIGRLGNGVNHEFVNKIGLLPWWSAEAILDLILFGIIWRLALRGSSSQVKVGTYLVGYGVIRFVLEFWRENNWISHGLGVAQWFALTSVVVGLFLCLLKDVHD